MSRRTAAKLVAIVHGIFEAARPRYGVATNPARDVTRWKLDYAATALEFPFYEPEQVYALQRAAASEQDGAIYVTAAFSGLRLGELLGLRVRDVDFDGDTIRVLRSIDISGGSRRPEERQGPLRAACSAGRDGAREAPSTRDVHRAMTTTSSSAPTAATSTAPRSDAATAPRRPPRSSRRSASTISATRSRRSSRPIRRRASVSCKPGSDTPTSGRWSATATTGRRRRPPSASAGSSVSSLPPRA